MRLDSRPVSLVAINGLRISEALGADIDALGIERGHRALTIPGKGGLLAAVHKSLGLQGITVTVPDEIGPARDRALPADRPTLIDVHTDPTCHLFRRTPPSSR